MDIFNHATLWRSVYTLLYAYALCTICSIASTLSCCSSSSVAAKLVVAFAPSSSSPAFRPASSLTRSSWVRLAHVHADDGPTKFNAFVLFIHPQVLFVDGPAVGRVLVPSLLASVVDLTFSLPLQVISSVFIIYYCMLHMLRLYMYCANITVACLVLVCTCLTPLCTCP